MVPPGARKMDILPYFGLDGTRNPIAAVYLAGEGNARLDALSSDDPDVRNRELRSMLAGDLMAIDAADKYLDMTDYGCMSLIPTNLPQHLEAHLNRKARIMDMKVTLIKLMTAIGQPTALGSIVLRGKQQQINVDQRLIAQGTDVPKKALGTGDGAADMLELT